MVDFVIIPLSNSIVIYESKAVYVHLHACAVGMPTSSSKHGLTILDQLILWVGDDSLMQG